ncbi:exodeoxyribonuclease VII small subunit [Syntrophotalea acetylenivorans]|uniref:Exodeoxyribonuclease 7 small subunit n=1 Tax=Syntrophotalea acetylenivorans TaxID=1842532 RepID=A0A1L3GLS0_9BACT|nr:exodeoxyribonuclease VII small subunit [Syntrophotalea acetylenivorans]APG26850.1 exodeoxyribonuclease VII small subunit [Syntrophotalea acetylenivorans]
MAKQDNFETALHTLEGVVDRLENADLSLEEALSAFELGVKSASRCQKLLQAVETQVDVLLKKQDQTLTTEKFQE